MSLEVALRGGSLELTAPLLPQLSLRGLRPEVISWRDDEWRAWRPQLRQAGSSFAAESADCGLSVRLQIEHRSEAIIVSARLRNIGAQPIRLARFAPLALDSTGECRIGADALRWSVYRQGYQSWTGTRSFRATEIDLDPFSMLLAIGLIDIRNPSPQHHGHFRSDMFTAIKNLRSGETLVCGFLTCRTAFGGIEVQVDGRRCNRLAATLDYDDIVLPAGEEIEADPLWITAAAGNPENDREAYALLSTYAAAVGAAMTARIPARNPVGWCSWYYYFTKISEDGVLQNLRTLQQLRDRFPCDYVQVDDGYQAEIGDWLVPNDKFPHGMAWLAEQIRAAGFEAGIWTAPFIARRGSALLRDHPQWFVKSRRGRPRFALYNPVWGKWGNCYALDTTHPEVLAWLRQTFRTLAREWGYRVLKLDFLFAAALPGQRYDPRATRAAALRRGLDAIREGAGDDVFLLGCGCPLGPAIGVVDAMRIGPDVSPYWSNVFSRGPQRDLHGLATKHAIRNILTRAFLHRRWWLNDPDCLMIRDLETDLSADEVRTLATAIAATDGMIVLSDPVDRLSEARLQVLARTLAVGPGEPTVADLMRADIPELIVLQAAERTLVAVFNFDDQPREKVVDLSKLPVTSAEKITEWWSGEPLHVVRGHIDLGTIPAHGCRVIALECEA